MELIARRWGVIFLATILGVSICVLLIPVLDSGASALGDYFEHFRLSTLYALGSISLLGIGCKANEWGALRISHLRVHSLVRYPPIWLAGIVGAIIYVVVRKLSVYPNSSDYSSMSLFWIGALFTMVFGLILLGSLGRSYLTRTISLGSEGKSGNRLTIGPDFNIDEEDREFLRWLDEESPILNADQDAYDRGPIARRIARILQAENIQSIGITGDLGCGKTSVLNLTREILTRADNLPPRVGHYRLIETRINTWGLSRKNLAEYILSRIVDSLSNHVDTIALGSLPHQYVEALNGLGGSWFDPIVKLTTSTRDPLTVLREVDDVLRCLDYRIVVFIEDVERNCSDELVRVELFALLDRLKTMKNLTFVIAIGKESTLAQYLDRILNRIESIQPLQRDESRATILKFRRIARKAVEDRCIFIYTEEESADRLDISRTREDLFDFVGLNDDAVMTHMASLLNTPRIQKLVLRSAWSVWQSLWGEADLDEIIAISILKHTTPTLYAFVTNNLSEIRRAAGDSKRQEHLHRKLEDILDGLDWRGRHARRILEYLFSGTFTNSGRYTENQPQRVASAIVNDYWVRIEREELQETDHPLDQSVLQAIETWKRATDRNSSECQSLARALVEVPGFVDLFELLGVSLLPEDIKLATSQLVAHLLRAQIDPEFNPYSSTEYPELNHLRRMYNRRTQNIDKRWLLNELESSLPSNLRLSNSIYALWRPELEPDGFYEEYVAVAKASYSKNPQGLVKALSKNDPYSIYKFCVHFSSTERSGPGFDAFDWKWLGKVLIDAADLARDIVVPQILILLTAEDVDMKHVRHYTYLEDRARSLFGQSYKRRVSKVIELGAQIELRPEISNRLETISNSIS